MSSQLLGLVIVCIFILPLLSACSSTISYPEIVQKHFPNLTPLKKEEFKLEAMINELPPEELKRVIKHPQYIEADINLDGVLDFAHITIQRHTEYNRISSHIVGCINQGHNSYDCTIIYEDFSVNVPHWHYLDIFILDEPKGETYDCGEDFPLHKEVIGVFPILGCCFSLYYYDTSQGEYRSCDLGD